MTNEQIQSAIDSLKRDPPRPELLWRDRDWQVIQTVYPESVVICLWCAHSRLLQAQCGESFVVLEPCETVRLPIPQTAFHAVADAMGGAPMRLQEARKALLDAKKGQ